MDSLDILQYFVGVISYEIIFGRVSEQFVDNSDFLVYLDDILRTDELRYLHCCVTINYEFAVFVYLEQL